MKIFPKQIDIKNITDEERKKKMFDSFIIQLQYNIRCEIFDLIIGRKDENDYFAIDSFITKYNVQLINAKDLREKYLDPIREELLNLGWKTKYSYANTALFIYSSENPPTLCH